MNSRVQWLDETPGAVGNSAASKVRWLDGVGFGYEEGTPVWQPGLSEEEKKSYFPWGQYSDATKNLQQAINTFLATQGCGAIGVDGKLGAATCGAAKKAVDLGGPESVIGPPSTCKSFGPPPTCGGAVSPPPPVPECSPSKPCPSGTTCVDGKCLPGGSAPGGGGGGSGETKSGLGVLGIVLLAGAAVGAIYLAMGGVGSKSPQPAML